MEVLQVYDDFSKGHFGSDPTRGNGWFGGYNFIAMPNAMARIREGTVLYNVTGLPNSTAMAIAPGQGGIFYTSGTATWGMPFGGAPVSLTALSATVSGTANGVCPYQSGSLLTVSGDATYKVDTNGVTKLTGSPGGVAVAVLGDRIYVGGSGAANRIRWSDAANENSWTAGNILDVGVTTGEGVQMMRRQRDSLIIATKGTYSNAPTHWWRLSGTPAAAGITSTQTLTPILAQGPIVRTFSSRTNDGACEGYGNRIWFLNEISDSGSSYVAYGAYGWIDSDLPKVVEFRPEVHNGADYGSIVPWSVAASPMTPSALFLHFINSATTRFAYIHEGAWADLDFPVGSAVVSPTSMALCTSDAGYVIARSGDASNKAEFQQWWPVRNIWQAPLETDRTGASNVTGEIHSPTYFDPQHRMLQVQAVTVDFRHYSANTTMTCAVVAHGVYQTPEVTSTTIAIPSVGSPSAIAQRSSYTFPISPVTTGRGFQVRLTACRAVAIERITVLGEVVGGFN